VLKKGEWVETFGLIGDVAIGVNCESTVGLVTAVYNAVKKRRGPAGFGMIMTSGIGMEVPTNVLMMELTVSLRCL